MEGRSLLHGGGRRAGKRKQHTVAKGGVVLRQHIVATGGIGEGSHGGAGRASATLSLYRGRPLLPATTIIRFAGMRAQQFAGIASRLSFFSRISPLLRKEPIF